MDMSKMTMTFIISCSRTLPLTHQKLLKHSPQSSGRAVRLLVFATGEMHKDTGPRPIPVRNLNSSSSCPWSAPAPVLQCRYFKYSLFSFKLPLIYLLSISADNAVHITEKIKSPFRSNCLTFHHHSQTLPRIQTFTSLLYNVNPVSPEILASTQFHLPRDTDAQSPSLYLQLALSACSFPSPFNQAQVSFILNRNTCPQFLSNLQVTSLLSSSTGNFLNEIPDSSL